MINSSKVPPAAEGRFVEADDDTIIDTKKRLVWAKRDSWQMTQEWMSWQQVKDYVDSLNRKKFAGYTNWRLPTSDEAKSLFHDSYINKDNTGQPAALHAIFPPGFGFLCWTSEVRNKIQAVRFGYRKGVGSFDSIYRTTRGTTRYVRDIEK